MKQKMINTYLYTRYERFWHWMQTMLIIVLLITGFEVHDFYTFLGFETAVKIHNYTGIFWLIAFTFFVFWVFTTGEWKQYIPTTKKMIEVMRYYAYGIFKGEEHPVPKRKKAKHNPLQRLSYLSLSAFLLPVQMLTGCLYWTYNSWEAWGLSFLSLKVIALIHMICAFGILQFIIIHVYMTTTGHSVFAHIRAMITGWEEVEEGVEIEAWEKAGK
ncbi:MAG: cytochrome B [Desulfobacterales bacterium]|jgi:thiosulfate reductase cytochrome b subunit|nr:cytochrome B [Desulfobacteraceae bacterium]MBT7697775.1 cytochrome B [Desulfobacterales bacterium]